MPRVKPFKYTYEKEIVMYAYFKNLDYFSTECIYSPFAARGLAREYIKDLEAVRPRAILDLIHAGEDLRVGDAANAAAPQPGNCERCGYLSSQVGAAMGRARECMRALHHSTQVCLLYSVDFVRSGHVQGVRAFGRFESRATTPGRQSRAQGTTRRGVLVSGLNGCGEESNCAVAPARMPQPYSFI